MDNHEQKFSMYVNRFNHAKISEKECPEEFLIMLTEPASTFYKEYLKYKSL